MSVLAIITSAIAVITDLKSDKIPNILTIAALIIGIILRIMINGAGEVGKIVIDVAVVFAITFVLFLIKALRGGDGKLLCAISAMLGLPAAAMILFGALVLAAVVGCIKMIFTKRKLLSKTMIHFSVPMACSVILYVTGLITN